MESSDLMTPREFLAQSRIVLDACIADDEFSATIVRIVDVVCRSLRQGGKLLLAGNGGSAGDAQHIAGEFLSRLNYDRAPLPAVALTTDTSVLTAIGNDYGYDLLFERQVLGLGRAGDVLIAISTSGNSANIINALKAARRTDIVAIGFSGQTGGKMCANCDHVLRVPSLSTPFIQQIHIVAAHIICGMVEAKLFPRPAATAV